MNIILCPCGKAEIFKNGLCSSCYYKSYRAKKKNESNLDLFIVNSCEFENCSLKKYQNGLCRKHYEQLKAHSEKFAKPKTCKKCDDPIHKKDLCKKHYIREYRKKPTNQTAQQTLLDDDLSILNIDKERYIKTTIENIIDIIKNSSMAAHIWAYENINLPDVSHPKIDFDISPDMIDILTQAVKLETERIILMYPSQTAKTLIMLIIAIYFAKAKQKNVLFATASLYLKNAFETEKLAPTLEASNIKYEESKGQFTLVNTAYIKTGLLSSKKSLQSSSIPVVMGDEYDELENQKFDPIHEIEQRKKSFKKAGLSVFGSTPKKLYGGITDLYKQSRRHIAKQICPHCNEKIHVKLEDLGFEKKKTKDANNKITETPPTPDEIKVLNLGYASCEKNGCYLTESDRLKMLKTTFNHCLDPEKISPNYGYTKHSWQANFVSYSQAAALYEAAKSNPMNLNKFYSDFVGHVNKDSKDCNEHAKKIIFEKLIADYRFGDCPSDVWGFTIGIDCQLKELYVTVIGFQDNGKACFLWRQIIDSRRWEDLDYLAKGIQRIIDHPYKNNQLKPIYLGTAIDSGYNAVEVYKLSLMVDKCICIKGDGKFDDPREKQSIPSNPLSTLYSLSNFYNQSQLDAYLGDNKLFTIPIDCPPDIQIHWKNEVKKEVQPKVFKYEPLYDKAPQHYRDATAYALWIGLFKGVEKLTFNLVSKMLKQKAKNQNTRPKKNNEKKRRE